MHRPLERVKISLGVMCVYICTGDKARGYRRGGLGGVELENGRGRNGKWGFLCSIRCWPQHSIRQSLQRRPQICRSR